MTNVEASFSDKTPLVQYEIAFPKKPPLLPSETICGTQPGRTTVGFAGITETLEDEIRWEPHVDEAQAAKQWLSAVPYEVCVILVLVLLFTWL